MTTTMTTIKARFGKTLDGALACLLATSSAIAAPPASDPEAWFRDSYAPLWSERPGEKLDDMLAHYDDEVVSHRADGTRTRTPRREWLEPSLEGWLEEGWLRAELTGLEVDRLNASTVVFKARWADHYVAEPTEMSCGWYLADRVNGEWRITTYADLDCASPDA